MSNKKLPLQLHQKMREAAGAASIEEPPRPVAPKVSRPPSRDGKAAITVFLEPEVRHQLKILAAERKTTVQELMARALNALFAEFGKGEIASVRD